MAKRRRKKIKYKNLLLLIIILFLIVYLGFFVVRKVYRQITSESNFKTSEPKAKDTEKVKKEQEYNNCLKEKVTSEEQALYETDIQAIDAFIQNSQYSASVYYEDITTGFTYKYKQDTVYYGCSLIKIVDALYLINKAINNEINLDTETVVYAAKYKMAYSAGLATRTVGEAISLRDLIRYAISLSDNSAHLMLIDYIGFSNLKNYGTSLGAKVILTGGDNFGNQTASDTNIYLKEAYKIITENKEYGPFLKEIMDNDERNAFNTDNIRIYHKYGSYGSNYHDIGLSLEEYPYTISILTLHENRNYLEVVQNIHAQVRDLHFKFHEQRKNKCNTIVYG